MSFPYTLMDHTPIHTNEKDVLLSHKNQLLTHLSDSSYLPSVYSKIEENEDALLPAFSSLSDLEVMYFFVHRETHDDEAKNRKNQTKKEYLRDLLQFYTFLQVQLQNEEVSSTLFPYIRKKHVRAYQEWLKDGEFQHRKQGYAVATRARKITVVKSFLEFLYEEEIVEFPLQVAFKKSTVRRKDKPKRELTYEEVKSLLDYYKDHPINHAILLLLATTGLRIQEVAKAKWGDLYYDPSINGGTYFLKVIGKNDVERHAVILPSTLESIKRFRKRRDVSVDLNAEDLNPLFTTNKEKAYGYKYLSQYVTRIIEETELSWTKNKGPITPHYFRHFFVNYSVLTLGLPIEQVQKTVGHQSKVTTEGYVADTITKRKDAGLYWSEDLL
ncbi:tyrosine-type recombinase/integrase [Thalassobacillus sp. C254]|uniref:tyrosine-type recombinase/integrase n=1 Tax=Thalassobacillus sp. C254 TaxID=1225341 RepID=UPI0006D2C0D6|nr:tyrosine-type recombinase/integrase [Thalassobacillus sp. C254]